LPKTDFAAPSRCSFVMLTTIAICIALSALAVVDALAGFDCENVQHLGCAASNSGGGCCSQCVAQIGEDTQKIASWVTTFKAQNPSMTAQQIDAYESPDRLDWGHPALKNCYYCAGQCWNNAEDNTACQVGMNPTKKRSLTELAKEHALGLDTETSLVATEEHKLDKRTQCSSAELAKYAIYIPGLGKRYHCDAACLNQFGSKAPTPVPTPHPGQIGNDFGPTPPPETYGQTPPYATVTPPGYTTSKVNPIIIGVTPANSGANNVAMGMACVKDNELCGMAGTTKLFCKCKVCGFKGTTCAPAGTNSVSFVAAMVAMLVAVRFL